MQDGTLLEGNGIRLRLETGARTYDFNTEYNDNTEGFRNRTGSFRRPDVRRTSTYYDRKFWHNGKFLIWHGPEFFMNDASVLYCGGVRRSVIVRGALPKLPNGVSENAAGLIQVAVG